ncbi:hypothetical protein [Escherichia coli]|uniref:hypothetical protein n=1 Tax=Escherichia coli TaxID=562 RepID=UPI00388E121F
MKWWPDYGYTKGQFWYLRSVKASYLREKELVALTSGKQTTVGSGGFLFTEQETTLHSQKSQDDPYTFCILSTHQKWSQTVSPVMNITVWLIKDSFLYLRVEYLNILSTKK